MLLQRYFQYKLTFKEKSVVFCYFEQKISKCGGAAYCGYRITVPLELFSSPCLRYTVCPVTTIPINNSTSVREDAYYSVLFALNEMRPTFKSYYMYIVKRDEIYAKSYQKVAVVPFA